MQKRILMLSTVHSSGHARYHGKLAAALGKAGFEVETWARGDKRSTFLPQNVKVRLIPPRGKIIRFFYHPSMFLRALTGDFDLVVVVPPETVPVGLLLHLFGKRVLWDVEEDGTESIRHSDWIPKPLCKPIAFIYSLIERLAAVTFPAVSYAEDSYAPRFKTARRALAVHNYPWKPTGPDMSRGETAKTRWSLDGPRLIYVGVVTSHHGIDDMIKVVALLEDRCPQIRLDVLGNIPSKEFQAELLDLINNLKSPRRITLHGHVPFDQLAGFLQAAHFGLMPLWLEPNFVRSEATKLFEYCLAGLPMVVGDVPVWRRLMDIADSGEAAPPRDITAWADAVERLWSRGKQELETAGRRARDLIYERDCFWEVDAKRFIDMCNEIMDR